MHFQLHNLNQATFPLLPDSCARCGWWQGYDQGWSKKQAQEWNQAAEERFGRWGKLGVADGKLLGMIQFAPAPLFFRKLPCGPAARDSVLLSCSLLEEASPDSLRKSLLLALLAELRDDDIDSVEAFCHLNRLPGDCRFFKQDFLRDCGFYPVRSLGVLQLMRLELGGLTPVKKIARTRRRHILERIKRPAPAPVAFCSRRHLPLACNTTSV